MKRKISDPKMHLEDQFGEAVAFDIPSWWRESSPGPAGVCILALPLSPEAGYALKPVCVSIASSVNGKNNSIYY